MTHKNASPPIDALAPRAGLVVALNAQGDAPALGAGIALALNALGAAPEWTMLVPAGPRVVGNDGRVFKLSDPQTIVDAFQKGALSLPVDVNHAEFYKATQGDPSPASGWIEQLEVREGAIWGRVAWTQGGEAAINSRAYRYLSPALLTDKDGNVLGLAGAGLVNRPNFNMPALNAADDGALMKSLLKTLGLPETASESDAIAAVEALKSTQLNAVRTAPPSLELFVPRADYDLVRTQLNTANTALAAHVDGARKAKVDAFIEGAVKEGKIAPASRDHYLALCATNDGFAQVRGIVEATPSFFKRSGLDDAAAAGSGEVALNARERELIAQGGVTEEQFLAAKKAREAKYAADAA